MYFLSSCFSVERAGLDVAQIWDGREPPGLDEDFRESFDGLFLARAKVIANMLREILSLEGGARNRIAPGKSEPTGAPKLTGDGPRPPVGQSDRPDREDKRKPRVFTPDRGQVEIILFRVRLPVGDGRVADEQLRVGGFVGRNVAGLEMMELA